MQDQNDFGRTGLLGSHDAHVSISVTALASANNGPCRFQVRALRA